MKFRLIVILGVAFLLGNLHLQANRFEYGLEYNTELQTNFRGDYNWVNMLRLDGAFNLSSKFTIQAATISIAKSNKNPIVDDLQGFSNIEEDNLTLGIALLGVECRNRKSTFFLGIRNVGEDYFTSPLTSLFISSSCGIFPTIAGNYEIANYPLSSWCFHYKAEWDKLTVQASLYEGLGHRRIFGHDNVFRFSPKRDGLFLINSVEYDRNGSNYSLGYALFYGVHNHDDLSIETASPQAASNPSATQSKSVSFSPWANVEQRITENCSLLLQASCSTWTQYCRYYFGLGASYQLGKATFGIFADYARYTGYGELASELTCNVALTSSISIQPTFELIRTDSQLSTVGLVRFQLKL